MYTVYKHFEIEYRPGCIFSTETVYPRLSLSLEMSPDGYESEVWTHEIILSIGIDKNAALRVAKNWIDWCEMVLKKHRYDIEIYEIEAMCDENGMYIK